VTEPRHVDEFIDDYKSNAYAAFVLNWFRAPASHHSRFSPWMKQHKLFGTYNSMRFRVTGASRLGDVFLCANFDHDSGYKLRVDVDEISNWSDKP
jgi:hypothetical protein